MNEHVRVPQPRIKAICSTSPGLVLIPIENSFPKSIIHLKFPVSQQHHHQEPLRPSFTFTEHLTSSKEPSTYLTRVQYYNSTSLHAERKVRHQINRSQPAGPA